MNLNLGKSSDTEFIRFAPVLNSWLLDGEEVELEYLLIAAEHLETGWGKIQKGVSPLWVWDEILGEPSTRPDKDYKRGFRVPVYLPDHRLWRWWHNTTLSGNQAMSNLWDHAVEQENITEDDVWPPVDNGLACKYDGSVPLKVGRGTTRIPTLTFVAIKPYPSMPPSPVPFDDSGDDDIPF